MSKKFEDKRCAKYTNEFKVEVVRLVKAGPEMPMLKRRGGKF